MAPGEVFTPTLAGCPEEVIEKIFSEFLGDASELARIGLVSRQFRQISRMLMFKRIVVHQEHKKTWHQYSQTLLLQELLRLPNFAGKVKQLRLENDESGAWHAMNRRRPGPEIDSETYQQERDASADRLLSEMYSDRITKPPAENLAPAVIQDWVTEYGAIVDTGVNLDPAMRNIVLHSLLILACPQLRHLHIEAFALHSSCLDQLFHYIEYKDNSAPVLQELRSLELPVDALTCRHEWEIEPRKVAAFIKLPKLQSLTLSVPLSGNRLGAFRWPQSGPPSNSRLSSLTISGAREKHLGQITRHLKNLKYLKWQFFEYLDLELHGPDHPEVELPCDIQLTELGTSLGHVSATLEDLVLQASINDIDGPRPLNNPLSLSGSLDAMASLHTLRRLQLPWAFAFGLGPFEGERKLAKILPPGLELLTLTDDLTEYDREEWKWEYDEMIATVKSEIVDYNIQEHCRNLRVIFMPFFPYMFSIQLYVLSSRASVRLESRQAWLSVDGAGEGDLWLDETYTTCPRQREDDPDSFHESD